MADGILKGRYHKFFRHPAVHRYTDYLVPAKVHDAGKVKSSFIRRYVCDIAYHFLARSDSRKFPVEDIFYHREVMT